jgi:hypothetical protein
MQLVETYTGTCPKKAHLWQAFDRELSDYSYGSLFSGWLKFVHFYDSKRETLTPCVVIIYTFENRYQHFERIYCLHLQSKTISPALKKVIRI